jgi:pilus assembly protein CpaC
MLLKITLLLTKKARQLSQPLSLNSSRGGVKTMGIEMLSRKLLTATSVALAIAASGTCAIGVGNAFADDGVITINSGSIGKSIKIAKGKPKTVRVTQGFSELVVGDPEIANITPLTDQSFYVLGHKLGTTGIAMFDENKKLIGSVDIEVTYDTQQLNNALKQNIPDSTIKATSANGQVVLSGAASDKVSAEKATKIAKQFNEGNEVIDSVNVTSSQQVQLDVRFVEVNRQTITKLGVKSSANFVRGIDGIKTIFEDGAFPQPRASTGQIVGQLVAGGLSIDATIDALETRGLARRLAEPNLVARSGQKASFLAGGEVPIPVAADNGSITVEYKKYGVSLEFTPTVLADGLISLDIVPEVSAIDNSNKVAISANISVPSFIVRRAETSVDLKSGQSFMIAGLLETFNDINIERTPGIGKAPVIGSLFSSKGYQKRETDLVILITPHLVRPIDPSKKIATPLDGTSAPSNVDFFAGNIDEIKVSDIKRGQGQATIPGAGHFLELDAK